MEIRSLQLASFRNYETLEVSLGPGMHVFAGSNAQGKTNLLEGVYVAATGRSTRTRQESELIAWGAEIARVRGVFESAVRGAFTVEVSLARKASGGVQKRLKVNGAARSVANLAGLVPVVLFLVDDLEIIRGEPARRRDFLDTDLSATSRTYAWALRQYTRVVEQRNRLLKEIREGAASLTDLPPWNAQLAAFGGRLLEIRTRFLADLNAFTASVYQGLTASEQALTLIYRREGAGAGDALTGREEFALALNGALEEMAREEVRRGSSLVGPHRDDLQLLVDGKDVRQYGSQGEQRTAALALRIAEFFLLKRLTGESPVLLLDDILSELDRTRRAALLAQLAPIAQVIVTTTDVDAVGLPPHADVRRYQVERGSVTGQS